MATDIKFVSKESSASGSTASGFRRAMTTNLSIQPHNMGFLSHVLFLSESKASRPVFTPPMSASNDFVSLESERTRKRQNLLPILERADELHGRQTCSKHHESTNEHETTKFEPDKLTNEFEQRGKVTNVSTSDE